MTASTEPEKLAILQRALTPYRICLLDATTKDEALHHLIDVLAGSKAVTDKEMLTEAVFKREAIMSTGIGMGLAVPHVRLPSVRDLVMAIGISREGICDYASLDDKPVRLVFLIAAPESAHFDYLRLLSAISARAKALNGRLRDCTDPDAFYAMLTQAGDAAASEQTD